MHAASIWWQTIQEHACRGGKLDDLLYDLAADESEDGLAVLLDRLEELGADVETLGLRGFPRGCILLARGIRTEGWAYRKSVTRFVHVKRDDVLRRVLEEGAGARVGAILVRSEVEAHWIREEMETDSSVEVFPSIFIASNATQRMLFNTTIASMRKTECAIIVSD